MARQLHTTLDPINVSVYTTTIAEDALQHARRSLAAFLAESPVCFACGTRSTTRGARQEVSNACLRAE